jgi:bifunctional non-homologous end joining protein LigD
MPHWLLFKGSDSLGKKNASPRVKEKKLSIKVDPLPDKLEVQKAMLSTNVPEGNDWLHEIKLDGYRIVARLEKKTILLLTRGGQNFNHHVPKLAKELGELPVKNAMLDGEIVYMREDGHSDFQKLQNALSERDDKRLFFWAFDIIFLNDRDLRTTPLEERKLELKSLLAETHMEHVRFSEHTVSDGSVLLKSACKEGLEGIVSKRRDAPYRAGRNSDWLKIKCRARQEFVIGGFSDPEGSRSHFGSLLVGLQKENGLFYCGKVGTGFSESSLADLRAKLVSLEQKNSPFANPPLGTERRGVHWVKPVLVAEIEFKEFTADGRLRHPSFCGLRVDKLAKEVIRERPVKTPLPRHGLPLEIKLTHPDKVLYSEKGITKKQVAEYFARVAPYLLPHVVYRPLSLLRCPQGRERSCFFQKHLQKGQPEAILTVPIEDDSGVQDYMYIQNEAGLGAIAQMGTLEIHTWGTHIQNYEKPDLLVFDLDPDPSVPWERVVETAVLLHTLFEQLELESFVKTTGGKGLHVCLPFSSRLGWDETKEFSHDVAESLARHAPDRYVVNMSKTKRKGKIFIDYLRNGRGATFIAPYSTRARPNAPIATPVTWEELSSIHPDSFNLVTLPKRLTSHFVDPWQRMKTLKQTLSLSKIRSLTHHKRIRAKG